MTFDLNEPRGVTGRKSVSCIWFDTWGELIRLILRSHKVERKQPKLHNLCPNLCDSLVSIFRRTRNDDKLTTSPGGTPMTQSTWPFSSLKLGVCKQTFQKKKKRKGKGRSYRIVSLVLWYSCVRRKSDRPKLRVEKVKYSTRWNPFNIVERPRCQL